MQTFGNLPSEISDAISGMLSQPEHKHWVGSAKKLHERYMEREKDGGDEFIHDTSDVLAYLGLRVPATYAQVYSALLQVKAMLPTWKPTSVLDLGSGPGTGVWAAKKVWTDITKATCIDRERYFHFIGQQIMTLASLPIDISWKTQNLMNTVEKNISQIYDIVIISNVLNELTESERAHLLNQAYARCHGIMIIIEPGTPLGFNIVQTAAKTFSAKSILVAPYIANTFVESDAYWIHFPQRFIRPEFQRHIRQQMRSDSLMASDWEEAKYTNVALGKLPPEETIWGRCIGPVTKQKGFLEIPILTKEKIIQARIMKRHKNEYSFAKNLAWGDTIKKSSDVVFST